MPKVVRRAISIFTKIDNHYTVGLLRKENKNIFWKIRFTAMSYFHGLERFEKSIVRPLTCQANKGSMQLQNTKLDF